MIVYLDTSAIVPLLIRERSSATCLTVRDAADEVVTSQLAYVECVAALAAAARLRRITTETHRQSVANLDALWSQIAVLPVDEELVSAAAGLAASHALRGYDAVHCASALRANGPDLVAAAGDQQLLSAWSALGLPTVDVNA